MEAEAERNSHYLTLDKKSRLGTPTQEHLRQLEKMHLEATNVPPKKKSFEAHGPQLPTPFLTIPHPPSPQHCPSSPQSLHEGDESQMERKGGYACL